MATSCHSLQRMITSTPSEQSTPMAPTSQNKGQVSSKRLADTEKEGAEFLSGTAVEFETVIEAQHDEGIAKSESNTGGRAKVAKPEVGHLREHVSDVDET